MNNRYIMQEILNNSGFIHYEIIDTQNKCTVYTSKDYIKTIEILKQLNNNNYLYEPQNDKWYTIKELINIIKTINNYTEEQAKEHINYSIKHGILYDYDEYIKSFKPFEN